MLNLILWVVAGVLAAIFFTAASVRALRYDFAKKQMAWVGAIPRPLLIFISCAEILGAMGLVLPGLTRIATQLIPLAAVCLAAVQLLAIFFHLSRHEPRNASANTVALAALIFLAAGRFALSPLG